MGDASGQRTREETPHAAKELLHCGNYAFTARKPSTMHYHRLFMDNYAVRCSDNDLAEQTGSSNGPSSSASFSSGPESIEETEGWFEMESIELDDGCAGPEEPHSAEASVIEVKEERGASSSKTAGVAKVIQRHQCPICGVPSRSRTNMQRHMLVHSKERPVICAVCGKGVRDGSSLKRHMLVHSNERPFGCTLCTSRFKFRCDLTKHMRTIHMQTAENAPRRIDAVAKDIPRHQCPICGVPSASRANQRRHMLVHTKQRPLTCAVCGQGIRDLSSLKRHMMLVHSDERPFGCTLCTSTFKLQSELNKHMKTVHGQTMGNVPGRKVERFAVNQFECKICLRAYPTRKRLRSHLLVHTEHKRVLCAICGNSYRDKDTLNRHMVVHSRERPFACSECDFTAKRRYYLTLHERRHTGELFRCPHCDYAHPLKSKLDRHSKVHANH